MNNKDYFDAFEKEHGRMPTFEEYCRDCSFEPTHMRRRITDRESKPGWISRLLRLLTRR